MPTEAETGKLSGRPLPACGEQAPRPEKNACQGMIISFGDDEPVTAAPSGSTYHISFVYKNGDRDRNRLF